MQSDCSGFKASFQQTPDSLKRGLPAFCILQLENKAQELVNFEGFVLCVVFCLFVCFNWVWFVVFACFWNLSLQRGARKGREVQLSTSQACLQRLYVCFFTTALHGDLSSTCESISSLFYSAATYLILFQTHDFVWFLIQVGEGVLRPSSLSLSIAARISLSPVLRLCGSAGPSLYL